MLEPGAQNSPQAPEPGREQVIDVPPAATPEKPKQTLLDLLRILTDSDEAIAAEFDPEQVVGDLRDKVDAVKAVMDRLEFQEAWCRQQATPFQKAAQALGRNRERLKAYVVFAMQQEGFEALPGSIHRAKLQDNPPSLARTEAEAQATDFVKYPNYVKQIRYYAWDDEAIRTALMIKRDEAIAADEAAKKARTFEVPELPFAKLTIGQHCRFYPNTPEKIPAKTRGKK